MKRIFTLMFLTIFLNSLEGQILKPKIDYTVDLYYDCDSMVTYEYGSISKEDWEALVFDDPLLNKSPTYKTVTHYENGQLSEQRIYSFVNKFREYSSRINYKIEGLDITETNTAILNGSEMSVSETYNADYIWVTKLAPRDILPPQDAGRVLLNPDVFRQKNENIAKIRFGSIHIEEVSSNESHKIFTNTQGDTVRIVKTRLKKDAIEVLAENHLRKKKETRLRYSLNGEILSANRINYQYKYNDKGLWVLLNRGGNLFRREIYE